ncbi:hypothetical protein ACFLU6_15880, partial [Acidobacteriota bacterium]
MRKSQRVFARIVMCTIFSVLFSSAARAAPGDLLGTVQLPVPLPPSTDSGMGLAFDGESIYYAYKYEDKLHICMQDGTGACEHIGTKSIVDKRNNPVALGVITWDPGRGKLWAATSGKSPNEIYLIEVKKGKKAKAEFMFNAPYPDPDSPEPDAVVTDGIAYDISDDTLWVSPDLDCYVYQYSLGTDGNPMGTLLHRVAAKDGLGSVDCFISGVAIGSEGTLYIGRNGFNEIRRIDKTTGEMISTFATTAGRVEDLACDSASYSPLEAILARDAFRSIYEAFEVEPGTCVLDEEDSDVGSDQVQALRRLEEDSQTQPYIRFEDGFPRFVSVRVPVPNNLKDDYVVHALNFLESYKGLYALQDPRTELYLKRIASDDNGGQHLTFGRHHDGIPVFGGEMAVHLEGGYVIGTNGNYPVRIPWLPPPEIAAAAAQVIAMNDISGTNVEWIHSTKLMYFDLDLIGGEQTDIHLAWRISLRGYRSFDGNGTSWLYFVDVHDGEVLLALDRSEEACNYPGEDFDIETANHSVSSHCWYDTSADDNWFDEDGPVGIPDADGWNAFNSLHDTYH